MKYSETPEDFKPIRDAYITERWSQLAELEQTWGERAVRYLFLVNAGGAIAVLTFMGANKEIADLTWTRWMLFLFVLGVIAVGVLQAYQLHFIQWLYITWRRGVSAFKNDQITWGHLTDGDTERSSGPAAVYLLGYLSFAMFLVSTAIGAWNFLLCR